MYKSHGVGCYDRFSQYELNTLSQGFGNLFNKSSVVAETGDRLATIDMSLKVGGCCAPFRG